MENQQALLITGIDQLDSNPMFLMGIAYKQFRAQAMLELGDATGISLEMCGALRVLNAHGKITQQALADFLLRNRSVTKRLVDNGIKLELITSSKSDTNKKIKLLSLTEKGQQVLMASAPILDGYTAQFQGNLSDQESQQLTQLLAKLVRAGELVD